MVGGNGRGIGGRRDVVIYRRGRNRREEERMEGERGRRSGVRGERREPLLVT